MKGQHRIGKILEVNVAAGKVVLQDKYSGQIQVTFHLHDAVATVPQQGEIWMVVDQGSNDWVLEKKLEDDASHLPITALNSGDKRYDTQGTSHVLGNVVNISGVAGVNIGSDNLTLGSDTQSINFQNDTINVTGDFNANDSPVLTLDTLPIPTFTLTSSGSLVGSEQTLNLISGTGINIQTWDDPTNGILNAIISSTTASVPVTGYQLNGTLKSSQPNLNFIPASGTTITISDDPSNSQADVTISSPASNIKLFSHAGTIAVDSDGSLNLLETVGSFTYPANSFVQIEYMVPDISFTNSVTAQDFQIDLYDSGSLFLGTLGRFSLTNTSSSEVFPFYGKIFYQTKTTPTTVNFTIMGTSSFVFNGTVTLNPTGTRAIKTLVTYPLTNFTRTLT